MKDKLAVNIKGRVYLGWLDASMRTERFRNIQNAIQPQAKEILAKRLIGHPSSLVDQIALYYQGNLLSSILVQNTTIESPIETSFVTVFAPGDFNGNFDEARLRASGIGNFSIINNIVDSKDNTQSLLVTWKIQII